MPFKIFKLVIWCNVNMWYYKRPYKQHSQWYSKKGGKYHATKRECINCKKGYGIIIPETNYTNMFCTRNITKECKFDREENIKVYKVLGYKYKENGEMYAELGEKVRLEEIYDNNN